jgi:hypothetical protein
VTVTTGVSIRARDAASPLQGRTCSEPLLSYFDIDKPNAEAGGTERRMRHVDIGKVERIIEIERIDERVPLRETEFVPAPELVPA